MKYPAIFVLPLLFLVACGSDNDATDPVTSTDNTAGESVDSPAITVADEESEPDETSGGGENSGSGDDNSGEPEDIPQNDEPVEIVDETDNQPDEESDPQNPDAQDPGDTDPDTGSPVVGNFDCSVRSAGSTLVSTTLPVHPNDNEFYYPVMGPQCVYPASQFDGPGLAYGDFLLNNNAWNGQQSSWNWEQCISLTTAANGSILPSWNYDWGNEDDLQPGLFEWEVKSFPEVIYGFKANDTISAPCAETGLPVPLADLPDIDIGYSYRAPLSDNRVGDRGDEALNPAPVTGGDRNIAIESFFHSSCDIRRGANTNMELELMVWLETGNERLPSGDAPIAQFTSTSGQTYDVYTKASGYVAYVAQNTVASGTLNWTEFVNDARSKADTYGLKQFQDSWCMANIIFGSEIWWGEGSVNLDYFQITSRY